MSRNEQAGPSLLMDALPQQALQHPKCSGTCGTLHERTGVSPALRCSWLWTWVCAAGLQAACRDKRALLCTLLRLELAVDARSFQARGSLSSTGLGRALQHVPVRDTMTVPLPGS